VIYGRPKWWDQAACRGRHDLLDTFVPPAEINTGYNRRALYVVSPDLLRLCKTCRVCTECLAAGERDRYAIRGGTTAQSREAARRKQRSIDGLRHNHSRL
jgi:hypothetical protein